MEERKKIGYEVVAFSKLRRPTMDYLHEARRKHIIHALIEVDVTKARQYLREHKARTGEALSFTAFITMSLAHAVDENKYLHAYRKGTNQLVIFGEVDISVAIEREVDGQKVPIMPHVVRAANTKTFSEIHEEIRSAQVFEGMPRFASPHNQARGLPPFVQRLFWRTILNSPYLWKRIAGTVGMTAIGMFGKGGGWGIPITGYTLQITLGGIAEKPGVVDGRIEAREYLSLTISLDHDIIDGAPAAQFTARLKELIESGFGLVDQDSIAAQIATQSSSQT